MTVPSGDPQFDPAWDRSYSLFAARSASAERRHSAGAFNLWSVVAALSPDGSEFLLLPADACLGMHTTRNWPWQLLSASWNRSAYKRSQQRMGLSRGRMLQTPSADMEKTMLLAGQRRVEDITHKQESFSRLGPGSAPSRADRGDFHSQTPSHRFHEVSRLFVMV